MFLVSEMSKFHEGIMFQCRYLQATVHVRDAGMNGLPGLEDDNSQSQSGLGCRWGREPITLSGQLIWQQCQLLWGKWCHSAGPEKAKPHPCAEGQGPFWGLCWCLVPIIACGIGTSSRSNVNLKESKGWGREPVLSGSARPRGHSWMMGAKGGHCHVLRSRSCTERDSGTAFFPWGFTKWEGAANRLRSNYLDKDSSPVLFKPDCLYSMYPLCLVLFCSFLVFVNVRSSSLC